MNEYPGNFCAASYDSLQLYKLDCGIGAAHAGAQQQASVSHLLSRRIAESKAPAAACCAARLPFCSQRCDAEMPGVGAANTAVSAACTGA